METEVKDCTTQQLFLRPKRANYLILCKTVEKRRKDSVVTPGIRIYTKATLRSQARSYRFNLGAI